MRGGAAVRLRTLVAISLLGVATYGGACSDGPPPPVEGLLRVSLAVQGGYVVRSVLYDVETASGALVKRGEVELPGGAAGTSFKLQLPPGDNDTILVAATSTSGVALRGVSKPFDIAPRFTTVVTVTLALGGADAGGPPGTKTDAAVPRGTLEVSGTIVPGAPPVIAFLIASPLEAAANGPIAVSVTASEQGGDDLSYAWTAAPDGSFATTSAASTTYSSSAPGTKVLTVTVSDRRTPALTASASVAVTISSIGSNGGGRASGGAGGGALSSGAGGLAVRGTHRGLSRQHRPSRLRAPARPA